MATPEGAPLAQTIRQKVEELKRLCKGLDEKTASRAPAGRWSPKQIMSHLCGPEGAGFMATLQPILEQETPRIDLEAENPFFTETRARMTFAELMLQMENEYDRIAVLAAGLSKEQLGRKAHIPLLKESPLGEYVTLGAWIQAIGGFHMDFHITHMREILQALGVAPTS